MLTRLRKPFRTIPHTFFPWLGYSARNSLDMQLTEHYCHFASIVNNVKHVEIFPHVSKSELVSNQRILCIASVRLAQWGLHRWNCNWRDMKPRMFSRNISFSFTWASRSGTVRLGRLVTNQVKMAGSSPIPRSTHLSCNSQDCHFSGSSPLS